MPGDRAEEAVAMRALVVYESMFGNTHWIAEAIAEGIAPAIPVEVAAVGTAPARLPDGVSLLVVGGPTHAFGMSRPGTRADAAKLPGIRPGAAATGLREWLDAVEPGQARVATFDTRIQTPAIPGSAAKAAQKRLRRKGLAIAAPATSFYVVDKTGPLVEGEIDRARRWGATLAECLVPAGT
jgi:hypothetical protein